MFSISGCTEKERLTIEIHNLRTEIETAKQVEKLRIERDKLRNELNKFKMRPEANSNISAVNSND